MAAGWRIRMLGCFEVVAADQTVPRFRSRTAASLLALLALQPGREVPRRVLVDALWPESDGDRQSQNLRRAVADVRSALEGEGGRGSIVHSSLEGVSLAEGAVETDVQRFLQATETGISQRDAALLIEALELYGGPVLSPLDGIWIHPFQLEYEERFAQAVEVLGTILLPLGRAKEMLRIGRAAVVAAPLREEIHTALIRAYRSCGMEAEAVRQFQELERVLDHELGEPPSEEARAALEEPVERHAAARPAADGDTATWPWAAPSPEPAGGALSVESPYYVERATDPLLSESLERRESVVLVCGPRQVGKTSMLARGLARARAAGMAVALTDMQTLGQERLESADALCQTLAHTLARQLGRELDLGRWNEWLGSNLNLDAAVGNLLEGAEGPVCWALDEADRVLGRPYANDFFGLLRSWHNRRALEPDGPWRKLTLVLAYATEAHLFITDLSQSPFNVGVRFELSDFTLDQVVDLHRRYGSPLEDGEVERLHVLTNGHPYLTRRALDAVLVQGDSLESLERRAALPDGPFGDHLRRLHGALAQDPGLTAEVVRFLDGEPFVSNVARDRLRAGGLLLVDARGRSRFRVPAYGEFLAAVLAR